MNSLKSQKTNFLFGMVLFLLTAQIGYSQHKLDLTIGATYKGISNNNFLSSINKNGQFLKLTGKTRITYQVKVKAIKDDLYILENEVTALKIDLEVRGEKAHFDSRNPQKLKTPMNIPFIDLVNIPITVKIDKSGNIKAIDLDKIKKSVKFAFFMLGGAEFATDFGTHTVFSCLPENPEVDQTWFKTAKDKKMKTFYKITSIFNDMVTLKTSSSMLSSGTQHTENSKNSPPLTGTLSAKTLIDKSTNINKNRKSNLYFQSSARKFPLQTLKLHSNTIIQEI